MTLPAKTKFDPQFPIVGEGAKPSQTFRDYIAKLDALVAALALGQAPKLVNAANDAQAAAAGVPLNNLYRNGSILMVRVV